MTPLLELKDIRRSYPAGDEQVEVLKASPSIFMLVRWWRLSALRVPVNRP